MRPCQSAPARARLHINNRLRSRSSNERTQDEGVILWNYALWQQQQQQRLKRARLMAGESNAFGSCIHNIYNNVV